MYLERRGKRMMSFDHFYCPLCKGALVSDSTGFRCTSCGKQFPIVDGVPDFYFEQSGHDFSDDPNTIWLDSKIVDARDTYYQHSARELKGMVFCMGEMGRRTGEGCLVLEVGTGTGHFTQWLAEVSKPGTTIYSFDFSWLILEKALARTAELPNVTLFRANAREALPFLPGAFDIVFIRLAPLGARGVSNMEAAFDLLKPGGWYFWAGWEREQFETPPMEWAFHHGYQNIEYHGWRYFRMQSEAEHNAWQIEMEHLLAAFEKRDGKDKAEKSKFKATYNQVSGGDLIRDTQEHVLIAQRPG
jgi:SAM-dependent methyltransferase